MRNVSVNLTIDRHITNGSAHIHGKVDGAPVSMQVSRGAADGTAAVSGNWDEDRVQLSFNRDRHEGYNAIQGQIGEQEIAATLSRRMPDGDTEMRMGGDTLDVNRQNRGRKVRLSSEDISGEYQRNWQGDELGAVWVGDNKVRFHIDRDPRSGNFDIVGGTSGGQYRLHAQREPQDGDLTLTGSLPQGAEMFPLLWEVLGDDKNVVDRNPMYPGSLVTMSMFMDQQTS